MIYTSISIGSHWQIISKRTQIGSNLMTNLYLVSNSQDNLSLRDFDWIKKFMLFSIDKIFNRKSHVGVSIGKFFNFNSF
jgi:hypothetical protein